MNLMHLEKFWHYCTNVGVVSKQLEIKETNRAFNPLTIVIREKVNAGTPVISVPYNAVLNCETICGRVRPKALPPFEKARRFFMQCKNLNFETAAMLWLVAFVACYRRQIVMCNKLNQRTWDETSRRDNTSIEDGVWKWPLAPLLSPTIQPELPYVFTNISCSSSYNVENLEKQNNINMLRQQQEEEYENLQNLLKEHEKVHVFTIHMLLEFYGRRARVALSLRPTRNELFAAYRTVVRRSIPLPAHCAVSAPRELSEFVYDHPELPLLPSLIPVIDLIQCNWSNVESGSDDKSTSGREENFVRSHNKEESVRSCESLVHEEEKKSVVDNNYEHSCKNGNCTLYTCIEHDFTEANCRRRLPLDSVLISARRVVVCTTRVICDNEELTFDVDQTE